MSGGFYPGTIYMYRVSCVYINKRLNVVHIEKVVVPQGNKILPGRVSNDPVPASFPDKESQYKIQKFGKFQLIYFSLLNFKDIFSLENAKETTHYYVSAEF